MSRDRAARSLARPVALLALAAVGCAGDARDTAARADTARHASADTARPAFAPPSPGFTSAHGTVAAPDTAAMVAAPELASLAPGLPDALTARAAREEQAAIRALPEGAGRELVIGACVTCHAVTMLTQQHKDTAGWNKTVTQMVGWGAPLAKDRQPALVAYLAEQFPPRAAGPQSRPVPP